MKILNKTSLILITALAISSCGDKRDGDAEAVAGLMGAFGSSNGTMSIQSMKTRARQKFIANQITMQTLKRIKSKPIHRRDVCGDLETNLEAALEGDCTVTSCTGDGTTGLSYSLSCTGISGSQTCGDQTYTVSDFQYDLDFSYTLTGSSLAMSFDMGLTGSVSGTLEGTVACNMSIDFTYDGSDSDSSYEFDCDSGDFSCSIDGVELSCARMKKVAAQMGCDS